MNEYESLKRPSDHDEPDRVSALIRTAGKRPRPRHEDLARVRSASRGAWQARVRSRRRHGRLFTLAMSVAAASLVATIVVELGPSAVVATVAMVQRRVEILSTGQHHWTMLSSSRVPILTGTRLRTVAGGRAAFDFSGTSLRVNSGTELIFSSPMHIDLKGGTLYLDSGSDKRIHEIVIHTAFGIVRERRTQFEVRALSSGLRLRVREGAVRLYRPARRSPLTAVAGQQLLLGAGGAVERQGIAPDGADWKWAEALAMPLRIDGRSAFEVLSWAARESGLQLIFADADAAQRARNAILRGGNMKLTPAQAIRVAGRTSARFEMHVSGDALVVRSR